MVVVKTAHIINQLSKLFYNVSTLGEGGEFNHKSLIE